MNTIFKSFMNESSDSTARDFINKNQKGFFP